jgi:hypothetical protein
MTETNQIVNAFHKDFVKTHMPEFLAHVKQQNKYELASQSMANLTIKKRTQDKTIPLHVMRAPKRKIGKDMTMAQVMDELAEIKQKKLSAKQRVDLAPKEFNIYSRAGTANVIPKGKKK